MCENMSNPRRHIKKKTQIICKQTISMFSLGYFFLSVVLDDSKYQSNHENRLQAKKDN